MLKIYGILFTMFCFASENQEKYHEMDAIACEVGADKGSFYHDYTRVYSKYFSPFREAPIKFLEIGLYKGSSAHLWEQYFPKAELHFMDICFDLVEHSSGRSMYHLVDQSKPDQLKGFIQDVGGGFDIILDDGGHTMNQQITSFKELFPHVKSGGMYIIEDLHTSYWKSFGGGNPRGPNTISFLKGLIDDVNYVGATSAKAKHIDMPEELENKLSYYQKEIESIHFYDSIAIIFKR